MNIFLDMDDVVADWMQHARSIVKRNWEYGQRIPDQDWARLKDNKRFYRTLPLKEGAHDLVNWCRTHHAKTGCGVYFLTALPHDYSMPWAAQDKVWWANEHFPGIPVFFGPFSYDKYRHCSSLEDILIDDRTSNCEEWTRAGGKAHIYRNWPNCKVWLEEELKLV